MVRALPIGEEATYDHSTVPMTTADDLFAAIDAGQPDRVASDPRRRCFPRRRARRRGVSAVMHALYHGQREVAEVVAGRLPALDVFEAAGLGRADEVARLVAGDPSLAGAWSADGFTALHFAAFFGGGGAAAALLAAGADPNLRSRNELEVMPIHSAVAGRPSRRRRSRCSTRAPTRTSASATAGRRSRARRRTATRSWSTGCSPPAPIRRERRGHHGADLARGGSRGARGAARCRRAGS